MALLAIPAPGFKHGAVVRRASDVEELCRRPWNYLQFADLLKYTVAL